MARTTTAGKMEKACDTLLEALNAEIIEVEMRRAQLYGTIRHIEDLRRSAIRSSAGAARGEQKQRDGSDEKAGGTP